MLSILCVLSRLLIFLSSLLRSMFKFPMASLLSMLGFVLQFPLIQCNSSYLCHPLLLPYVLPFMIVLTEYGFLSVWPVSLVWGHPQRTSAKDACVSTSPFCPLWSACGLPPSPLQTFVSSIRHCSMVWQCNSWCCQHKLLISGPIIMRAM